MTRSPICMAPIVRDRKGEYRKEFLELRKQGFQRREGRRAKSSRKLDGAAHARRRKFRPWTSTWWSTGNRVRERGRDGGWADSFRTRSTSPTGIAILETAPAEGRRRRAHDLLGKLRLSPPRVSPSPRSSRACFPFNAPSAHAPLRRPRGGAVLRRTPHGADAALSLEDGAIAPWRKGKSPYFLKTIQAIATPLTALTPRRRGRTCPPRCSRCSCAARATPKIQFRYDEGGRVYQVKRSFEGVITEHGAPLPAKRTAPGSARNSSVYQNNRPCGACGGYRLREEALAVKIAGLHVGQVVEMSIREALAWCESVPAQLGKQEERDRPRDPEGNPRTSRFSQQCGPGIPDPQPQRGHPFGRREPAQSASPARIGSGLTGVLYVLDEPSIGLHQRDNDRLLTTLKNLRDQGNTVIVVEHDEEAIREADYVFDIGPGAGVHGGQIVAQGTPAEIAADAASITGQYLSGTREIPGSGGNAARARARRLTVVGATGKQPQGCSRPSSRWASSSASPASPAAASRR